MAQKNWVRTEQAAPTSCKNWIFLPAISKVTWCSWVEIEICPTGASEGLRPCQSLPLSVTVGLGVPSSLQSWEQSHHRWPSCLHREQGPGGLLWCHSWGSSFPTVLAHTGCSSYCQEPYEWKKLIVPSCYNWMFYILNEGFPEVAGDS